mmetsp:Transcript_38942/g.47456  ORF Transcript_38942/g.47456 Transcript_38942/m.47456 type:complete len:98 (+) Transcript_38942:201-494(+)
MSDSIVLIPSYKIEMSKLNALSITRCICHGRQKNLKFDKNNGETFIFSFSPLLSPLFVFLLYIHQVTPSRGIFYSEDKTILHFLRHLLENNDHIAFE